MQDTKIIPIKHSNKILAFLEPSDWDRWQSRLEMVQLSLDQVLFDAGQKINYVYFPVTSIISQQYDFEDGKSAEFAQMGNEGLVGIFVFMGSQSTSSKAVVIAKGYAYRMRADLMLDEFNHSSSFRKLILRYMQVLMTHASQIAACNRRHSIDQQLSRTLLLNLDRVAGSELSFTHELIARSRGVRREGISEAAKRLQRSGLINYSRGCIHVIDRDALKTTSCECYSIIKNEYARLLATTVDK
jgi:CRP-like cAMP-binding protein